MKIHSYTNWDAKLVKALLIDAAETLRLLPSANLKNKLTYWPDVIQESTILWTKGYTPTRRRASPQKIDELDVILKWLLPLSAEERRIVWAKSCKIPWRKLEDIDGRSHTTLRKIYTRGVEKICVLLNKT